MILKKEENKEESWFKKKKKFQKKFQKKNVWRANARQWRGFASQRGKKKSKNQKIKKKSKKKKKNMKKIPKKKTSGEQLNLASSKSDFALQVGLLSELSP